MLTDDKDNVAYHRCILFISVSCSEN